MPKDKAPVRRFIALTAIPTERDAVRVYLSITGKDEHKGTIYERGTFSTSGGIWEAALVETGAGNVAAAIETERFINYFKPELVLFVGVAGGFKDVRLGDVVVANRVYWYESGKADQTFQTRPQVNNITYILEQLARDVARERNWLSRLPAIPTPPPEAHVGPIATGESVITFTDSDIGKLLKERFGDTLAVEMESHGVLQAVRANESVSALIVRGISDLIDNKAESDAQKFQEVAARHASAFAFEMLSQYTRLGIRHGEARNPEEETSHIETQTVPASHPDVAPTSDVLLHNFFQSLGTHYETLKKVCMPLSEGRNAYPDHCQRAAEQLKNLETFLLQSDHTISLLKLDLKLKIDNLLAQIRELQPALRKLKRDHPILKGQMHGANIPEPIRDKLAQFLVHLESLVKGN